MRLPLKTPEIHHTITVSKLEYIFKITGNNVTYTKAKPFQEINNLCLFT